MSDVPQETISLAAEVEVLRLVVVELVRRLSREDRSAIEALVQRLAAAADDLSTLPTSGEAVEELPHARMPLPDVSWAFCSFDERAFEQSHAGALDCLIKRPVQARIVFLRPGKMWGRRTWSRTTPRCIAA
jgi:hypothetical protein